MAEDFRVRSWLFNQGNGATPNGQLEDWNIRAIMERICETGKIYLPLLSPVKQAISSDARPWRLAPLVI
jgi:hypothetical protein